jgi:hypothetical protein
MMTERGEPSPIGQEAADEVERLCVALEEEVDLADALTQKAWALLETDAHYDCLTLGGPCDFCEATEDLNEVLQQHAQRRRELP